MFQDAYLYVKECEKCKLFFGKLQLSTLPLRIVVIDEPFKKLGFDFIRPINSMSSVGHMFILIETNYFNKWVELYLLRKKILK